MLANAPIHGQANYEPYSVSTLTPARSGDRPGLHARFSSLSRDIAADAHGHIFVLETDTVRKIAPNGAVTTLAGYRGAAGWSDGAPSTALFNQARDLASAQDNSLYVADTNNSSIRKITPDGFVTTIAGGGGEADADGSRDGVGRDARFSYPRGVAVAPDGAVFVADTGNGTIRRIGTDGAVTTAAGLAGDRRSVDGRGVDARFQSPGRMAFDAAGNLFVIDWDRLRKISPAGDVTTLPSLPGLYEGDILIDGAGTIYLTGQNRIYRVGADGAAVSVAGGFSGGVQESWPVDGIGGGARFSSLKALAYGPGGDILVLDQAVVRKMTPEGVVSTVAGAWGAGGWGPDGPDDDGTALRILGSGVAVDKSGNLYVAEYDSQIIRRLSPDGVITTVAGVVGRGGGVYPNSNRPFDGHVTNNGTSPVAAIAPRALTVDASSTIYFVEATTVRKLTPDGIVTTIAGDPIYHGTADGVGRAARFTVLSGVAVDPQGNLFLADSYAYTIRKMTPDGVVTTFAGSPLQHGHSDGWGSSARFAFPRALAVDHLGNVYVADGHHASRSNTIRKITPEGLVTTLAGSPGAPGNADGVGAMARFNDPAGVAVDPVGNVYVADRSNSNIRKVTPAGMATTLAGSTGANPGYDDGVGAAVKFAQPEAIAVDSTGNIYVPNGRRLRLGISTVEPRLLNVSTRLSIAPGDENVLIGGFIVSGTQQKTVLVRAVGPSLLESGLPNALPDTTLELYDSRGVRMASNDDWKINQQTGLSQESAIRSTAAPQHELESALLATVDPQQGYTAIVRGKGGATGTALVEVYDVNSGGASLLANISTRGSVGSGDDVMIGGFILSSGAVTTKVLVRALGPSLKQFGVNNALADTSLTLHDANGAVVTGNDNWEDHGRDVILATTLAPTEPSEAAVVAALAPGAYTAVVRGVGSTGVGLVEVYRLR